MSKVYLFSDITDSFALRLAQRCSENGDAVWGISEAALPTDNPDSVSFRNIYAVPGVPGSSLSAVSFFRKAVNETEKADAVLLFGMPVQENFSIADCSKLYWETLIDRKIKNMMFFLSEGVRMIRQDQLSRLIFIDYFENGTDHIANTLWKSCFTGIADRMCLKSASDTVPAEWYRLKNEKPEQAMQFVAEHLAEEQIRYPAVFVSEDKRARGFFRR